MSGGYYAIGYSVPDACWLVAEYATASEAAHRGALRRMSTAWRGCAWNSVPWSVEQMRAAVDHLHASLVSNLTTARVQLRRVGDAGYIPLPYAQEVGEHGANG